VRTVTMAPGATAAHIVHSSWPGSRDIEHIDLAHAGAELAAPPRPLATSVRTEPSRVAGIQNAQIRSNSRADRGSRRSTRSAGRCAFSLTVSITQRDDVVGACDPAPQRRPTDRSR
jgi:hypothetical protein